ARWVGFRQQVIELFGQVHEDRAAFEHAERLRSAAIEQCGYLAVGVQFDEARPELVPGEYLYHPGVIFRLGKARLEQFLEHDRGLHPVGRAQRIELEGMLADGEFAFLARTGSRAVDPGELAAIFGIESPYFGRGINIGHRKLLCGLSCCHRDGRWRGRGQAGCCAKSSQPEKLSLLLCRDALVIPAWERGFSTSPWLGADSL